jgi:predicted kinase
MVQYSQRSEKILLSFSEGTDTVSFLILAAGPPGSGKTSFAEYLTKKMKIPMVSKDILKEYLFDTVGFKNRQEKVALGAAAMEIMYHFAERHLEIGQPLILENNFEDNSKPGLIKIIEKYECNTITIMFQADIEVLTERFIARDKSPGRHKGHVINTQYPEPIGGASVQSLEAKPMGTEDFLRAIEQRGYSRFSIGGAKIIVDTTDFSKVSYDSFFF